MNRSQMAVDNFVKMIPQLRGYARRMTGNKKLQLQPGTYSHTDGNTIVIRPPASLAGKQRHTPGKCDTYTESGEPLCPACSTRQWLMVTIQHEIGHCVNGSFKELTMNQFSDMTRQYKTMGLDYKYVDNMYQAAARALGAKESFPVVALFHSSRSAYLPSFNLMSEDIRCNEQLFITYPELRAEFRSRDLRILEEGVPTDDGEVLLHSDAPLESQLNIGMYMKAFGHDYHGHLDPQIEAILDARGTQTLADKLRLAGDVIETAEYSVELYLLGKRNGLCVEPETDEELEELLKELMMFLAALLGHDEHGASGVEFDEDGKPTSGPAMHGRSEQSDADMMSEEELAEAINALRTAEVAPVNVGKVVTFNYPSGEAWATDDRYHMRTASIQDFSLPESVLGAAVTEARLAFSANRRTSYQRNMRSGKINGKMIARRVPFDDDRIFGKKVEPSKREYHVVIGMDISGSTSGMELANEKMAVLAQSEVLNRVGIKFEIWAHTTTYGDNKIAPGLYCVKAINEPWNPAQREKLRTLTSCGGNLDGHTLQFYRKQLDKSSATDKVLMYYTDGAMPASNYDEELRVLLSEVKLCNQKNYTLMAVGIGTSSPSAYGMDTARVDSSSDYRKVVTHLGKRLVR